MASFCQPAFEGLYQILARNGVDVLDAAGVILVAPDVAAAFVVLFQVDSRGKPGVASAVDEEYPLGIGLEPSVDCLHLPGVEGLALHAFRVGKREVDVSFLVGHVFFEGLDVVFIHARLGQCRIEEGAHTLQILVFEEGRVGHKKQVFEYFIPFRRLLGGDICRVAPPLPEGKGVFQNHQLQGTLHAAHCVVGELMLCSVCLQHLRQGVLVLEAKNLKVANRPMGRVKVVPRGEAAETSLCRAQFVEEFPQARVYILQVKRSHIRHADVHILRVEIAVENGGLPAFADAGGYPFGGGVKVLLDGLDDGMLVVSSLADGEVFPRNPVRRHALVKEAVLDGQLVAIEEGRQFAGILREQEVAFQFDNDRGIRSPVPEEDALLESAFAGVGMVNGLLEAKLVIFIERVDFQFLNVADLRDLFQFSQYERIRAERAARH